VVAGEPLWSGSLLLSAALLGAGLVLAKPRRRSRRCSPSRLVRRAAVQPCILNLHGSSKR
jgi:hypothetical protein